jgi:uncharacterized repeat protein (TIGR01451 family)
MQSRRAGSIIAISIAVLALELGLGSQPVLARPLDVKIFFIGCVDPCRNEGLEAAGESAPDFYAKVFINGVERPTVHAAEDQEAVAVDFHVFQEVPDEINDVAVAIQVWDHDSSTPDDLGDASPVVGKANLELVFHRNTGTWTGDVSSPTVCASGQEGGEPGGGIFGDDPKPAVQVCFTIADDPDTDNDALFDSWETIGIDADADGTFDVALPGASPTHADIYVWVDWMDCGLSPDCSAAPPFTLRPQQAVFNAVVQAFANAPVMNPDGTTGIALHVEYGRAIPWSLWTILLGACDPDRVCPREVPAPGLARSFDDLKRDSFGMNNPRRFAYHYVIFGDIQFRTRGSSGCAEIGGNDVLVTLGGWGGAGFGTERQQAATLMHELGHNLGLRHGGSDNDNFQPNHISVMNYAFQFGIFGPQDPTATLDYSRGNHIPLNEESLDEGKGIGGTGGERTIRWNPTIRPDRLVGKREWVSGVGAIDWNRTNGNMETGISYDVNGQFDDPNENCKQDDGERSLQSYSDFPDWDRLDFNFRDSPDFADGVHMIRMTEAEQSLEQYLEIALADLKVTVSVEPDPVVTGSNVTYTIGVANVGGSPASSVTVFDILPPSVTFVSCTATGGGVCGGSDNSRVVTYDSLGVAAQETITMVASVNCALPDGTLISNTASAGTADPERDSSDDQATVLTTASNPPPVISNVSVSEPVISPSPNHKLVNETVSYDVTDNCGAIDTALSVTSSEAVNGLGEGDTAPDWVIVDAHDVQLRAERSGMGSGRTYTITVTATDSAAGAATETVAVIVPKSQAN